MLVIVWIFLFGGIGVVEYYLDFMEFYWVYIVGFKVVVLLIFGDVYWLLWYVIVCLDFVMYLEFKCCYYSCGMVDISWLELLIGYVMVCWFGIDVIVVMYGNLVSIVLFSVDIVEQ